MGKRLMIGFRYNVMDGWMDVSGSEVETAGLSQCNSD